MKLRSLQKKVGYRIWGAIVLCMLATACGEDDIFTDNTIVVPPTESEEQNTDTLLIPDENLRLFLRSQLGVDILTRENLAFAQLFDPCRHFASGKSRFADH